MGKQILELDIQREKGKLYYLATSKAGNLVVCEAIMARGGKAKKKKK